MIELADAIDLLRRQLAEATRRAVTESNDGVVLKVENVEVTLAVELSQQTDAKAGINFWVFTIGAGGGSSVATTHTVKLSLQPCDLNDKPLKISAIGSDAPRPPGT